LEIISIDRMLLGSDWPHAEGVVQPVDFITDSLAWADDSTKRRIGRENAERLLSVDIA
jgi:predicted TIM-barrel fold metal-dependent hydrolase